MKAFVLCSILLAAATAFPLEDVLPFSVETRITGGLIATPNQFPYQIGMEMEKVRGGKIVYTWCGGSLISDRVILTAAHCLNGAKSAIVMLGAHNRYEEEEPGRIMVEITTENMIMHEKYNKVFSLNDIGLIILPGKVALSSKIQTINLPRRSQINEDFIRKVGIISGWGRRGDGPNDSGTRELRYVSRSILPADSCEKAFPMFKSYSQICVDGSGQKSACSGDSGGPFAIEEADGTKTLIGLTSYGRANGCQNNFPVSYTRVSYFLDWIEENSGVQIRK